MKKVLISCFAISLLCLYGLSFAMDQDKGPAEMTLQAVKDQAKKPKPAVFPHKLHQDAFACGDCHHSAKDGQQIPYEEGQPIGACEDCHYKGAEMPKGLDSYKGAAHKNCKDCHKKVAAENPELKEKFKGCMPCHPKKK